MIYEIVKRFDVVPNIRRANVEAHSGWVILELSGAQDAARRVRSHTSKRSAAPSTAWKATSSRDDATSDERSADEQRGLALLQEASDAILVGVERELPGWVERSVQHILDAWGRTAPDVRTRAEHDAVDAGAAATAACAGELRELFALDAEAQGRTPLEVVRRAYREPTAVLAAAGIPPVERDEFAERAWPDDTTGWSCTASATSATRTSPRCRWRGGWPRRRCCAPDAASTRSLTALVS